MKHFQESLPILRVHHAINGVNRLASSSDPLVRIVNGWSDKIFVVKKSAWDNEATGALYLFLGRPQWRFAMIRIQIPSATTEDFDHDTSGVLRDAIESKIRRLRFALARSEKAITAFEEKYHFSSSDLVQGKTVEDLESHDDYQEWVGEIHVRGRILAELDTLEHVVYEHS